MTTLASATLAVDLLLLKEIAMLVFIGIWCTVLIRLLVTRSKKYEHAARLPLEDDRVGEPREPQPALNRESRHV